jgi:carbonyl reductase 1
MANQSIDWNYFGTLTAIRSLLPLVRDGGRLVNVSSRGGEFSRFPSGSPLPERFRAASSVQDVTALMEEYKAAVADGTTEEKGWSARTYSVSKSGVTTVTRVIAEEAKANGSKTLINACCPGLVRVCIKPLETPSVDTNVVLDGYGETP